MTQQRRPKSLNWLTIETAPPEPGVYAWYYEPRIATPDLATFKEALASASGHASRRRLVESFLKRHVFARFVDSPYDVAITGALKPRFEGKMNQVQTVSSELVDRIAEDPDRLNTVMEALRVTVPQFMSPLYIGMAKDLRVRLRQHKRAIDRMYEHDPAELQRTADPIQSFAFEVVSREMIPMNLAIQVLTLDSAAGEMSVDLENLLNRINYPILGRN